ncbi:3-dehydroquinate synthase [Flammeovirgaceae bacterium SG7u.111]|nr:3-dehydroquinate synthase [Flammeovirgaceae bacterium SG7u.132]WPO37330.1 3-dehydroquinate synthase [Flammeovirgaceae bacterium SG7u.111]
MAGREITKSVKIFDNFKQEDFSFLSEYSSVAVLVDYNTRVSCYPLIEPFLPSHICIDINPGEEHKHLGTCQEIWSVMTDCQFDRKAVVLNLGGGVIGDMGGFCAATYKRGIDFLQIPTTLLAQVDASVGGKLGIDFKGFKNHIGVFQLPKEVWVHPGFLKTLSEQELRSGFAEVIKHCLIADASKWEVISQKSLKEQLWHDIIEHSIHIKANVVKQDPTEQGLRKILNFGHTIGHAIETYFLEEGDERLLHGEAIAIGMICEAYLSAKKTGLEVSESEGITKYISSIFGLPKFSTKAFAPIVENMYQDKKNVGGKIKCVMLEKIGKATFDINITPTEIEESLAYYLSL